MPSESTKHSASPGDRYRLSVQAPQRSEEGFKGTESGPYLEDRTDQTPQKKQSWLAKRRANSSLSVGEWLMIGISALAFVGVVLVGQSASWATRGQMAIVALVPLLIVTAILSWLDRWAPPPWRYKIMALIWGAGIAAGLAVIVNSVLQMDALMYTGDYGTAEFISAVMVAPFSEEILKGIGVVIILVWARSHISSNIGGLAMGGLVGAGFAYVENILYFLEAQQQGTSVLGFTIFARAVMSPFVHPMATSFTGLAVASALLHRARWTGWLWRMVLGLGAAIVLHALWNGLASLGLQWILWYILIALPVFVAWLITIIVISTRQVRKIEAGLMPYLATGWISAAELRMVVNPQARKYAKKWARRIGRPAPKRVKSFLRALGWLGLDQMLMERTGAWPARVENDRRALRRLEDLRLEFATLEDVHGATRPPGSGR